MTTTGSPTGARDTSTVLARLIERRRRDLALGQAAFARRVGVSQQTVSRWERGESMPQRTHLYDLAEVLGLDPDTLLDHAGSAGRADTAFDHADAGALQELSLAVRDAMRALLRVQAALDAVTGSAAVPDALLDLTAIQASPAEERAVLRALARRLTDEARRHRQDAADAREIARRGRGVG